jgi:hypothetical protein
VIATQLNAAYAPWLDLFLSSLRRSNPTIPVFVELVNTPPQLTGYFRERYPWAEILDVELADESRRVLAHRKVDTALTCLERYPGRPWYLICDVDLLFRRSLDPLIDSLANHDAGVVFRDGCWEGVHYDHLRVNSGFVAYKDARLLEAWKAAMAEPTCLGYDASSWFYDQVTLLHVTRQCPLDYLAIDDRMFINREFDAVAAVWSGHMTPKELMYLRFRDELESSRRLGGHQ